MTSARIFQATRRLLVAAGATIALSGSLQAATLEEIYNLAVENDPQLGSAEATFLSRNEVVSQSRALILPNVVVQGSTSDNRRTFPTNPPVPTQRFNDHGWAAVLNQPIFRLDSWYRFQQSKDIQAEAMANFAAEQQALLVRVAFGFGGVPLPTMLVDEQSITIEFIDSEQAAKEAGKRRSEGKDYVVKDGEVVHFLFNV